MSGLDSIVSIEEVRGILTMHAAVQGFSGVQLTFPVNWIRFFCFLMSRQFLQE